MKKMLLIGAMLVLGATSFAERIADLGDGTSAATGGTKLDVVTRGEVVDGTKKHLLIITPTVSAGADGTSLEFDFGNMKKGSSSTLTGKFTAVVQKKGTTDLIPLTGSTITVAINGGTAIGGDDKRKQFDLMSAEVDTNGAQKNLGSLVYELGQGSEGTNGLINADKTYEGKVSATVSLDKTNTGNFYHNGGRIDFSISNIKLD